MASSGGPAGSTFSGAYDNEVLDIKPLRSLSPLFPYSFGSFSPKTPPFYFASPISFSAPSQQTTPQPEKTTPPATKPQPAAELKTPPPTKPHPSPEKMTPPVSKPRQKNTLQEETEPSSSLFVSTSPTREKTTPRNRKRPRKETSLVAAPPSPEDPKEAVEVVLQTFDAIRRRLLQLDELTGAISRAEMKSGASMSRVNLRANSGKRIGPIPGISIGDIFFFRLEILLAGLHQQSMGGIDSAAAEFPDGGSDIVAVSVVSSGGTYDDDTHSIDSLIYSGQGGAADQKLEKGNLALERSFHRKNDIRVIRGVKEIGGGKIYIYDGMYTVEEYWTEKAKSGFNVFKFKLIRQPGQPSAFSVWKAAEIWKKEGGSTRGVAVRCLDLSAGVEFFPVVLVNEVDSDPNPEPFIYSSHHRSKLSLTPATRKISSLAVVNELSSPVAAMNKLSSPASVMHKISSPVVVNELSSPASATHKISSPEVVNELSSPASATHKISSPAVVNELSSPVAAMNEHSSPVMAMNELSSLAPEMKVLSSPAPAMGCGCEGVCVPGNESCACGRHNGGALPYSSGGLLVRRRPVIYECGGNCKCSDSCRNRLTQKPAKLHFEVFKTENRGWGLRSWDPIRCGSFVCEFVGDYLDDGGGDDDDDEFVFEGKSWEEGAEKWNYGPELVGEAAEEVAAPPVAAALTGKKRGNVARFINHSCSPNLFWQAVVRDGEEEGREGKWPRRQCHVMFFAMRHIPPMMELTFDYGAGGSKRKARMCACGSPNCHGVFYQR